MAREVRETLPVRPSVDEPYTPTNARAMPTKIETPEQGVAGFILPNDHVDVILTQNRKTGSKDEVTSETVLANVRVLAIDQTAEGKMESLFWAKPRPWK